MITAQRSLWRLGCFRVLVRAARRPVHCLSWAVACLGHLCTAKLPKVQIPMGNRRSSSCWLRRSWREVAAQALPQGGVLWSNHSATASLLHPCGLPMGSWVRYPCAVLRRPVEQACDGVAATMLMAEQSLLRRRSNASFRKIQSRVGSVQLARSANNSARFSVRTPRQAKNKS